MFLSYECSYWIAPLSQFILNCEVKINLYLKTLTIIKNRTAKFSALFCIMITYLCKEVYPQCASLTQGINPLTKLIKYECVTCKQSWIPMIIVIKITHYSMTFDDSAKIFMCSTARRVPVFAGMLDPIITS